MTRDGTSSVHAVVRSALARFLRAKRLASMPAQHPLRRSAKPLLFSFLSSLTRLPNRPTPPTPTNESDDSHGKLFWPFDD